MTPTEHAQAIRDAAKALNAALRDGAKAGVGTLIRLDLLADAAVEQIHEVRVTPYVRL